MAKVLNGGGVWIEGTVGSPPEGASGPLVFGSDWLLEMVRLEEGTYGFFWAPYAIIQSIPILDRLSHAAFVGFSKPGRPPADWLATSLFFELGDTPLPQSPDELILLVQRPQSFTPLEASRVSPLSRKVKNRIAATYRTNLSISDIAQTLGVSHAHITRQFKRDFGLTPVDYRHRLRVSDAMARLSQGESIVDVGYEVGFNDTTRFYEDFRKVTGTSPGKCR